MEIMIQRIKMAGMENRAYTYDVWVKRESLPNHKRFNHYTVIDGAYYVAYEDATLPDEYWAMPCGWDKHDLGNAHRKQARKQAWELVHDAFPETRFLPNETLPLLWASYDHPQTWDHQKIFLTA